MASDDDNAAASIKVSAHVLVQLGEELVTDVEQAILECVKNAYDADSPGCSVIVNTGATGRLSQSGKAAQLLRFRHAAENVAVSYRDGRGRPIGLDAAGKPVSRIAHGDAITRDLDWTGSIVIEDTGEGLSPQKIRTSWLVISGSAKRSAQGKKEKTAKGRTPLGDKGVGRLGSMKLGDILLVESAQTKSAPLASAAFRWADCEAATTVDEIPVRVVVDAPNPDKYKGTRVSVLGLRDLRKWGSRDRALEITKRLARLISPFEAKSQFPVSVEVDGHKSSLVAVTDTLLSRAIAEFRFTWREDPAQQPVLHCEAKFKERLFRPASGTPRQMEKVDAVFGEDDGEEFLSWLKANKRLKRFAMTTRPSKDWLVQVEQTFAWDKIVPTEGPPVEDPGKLSAAFYYFNLIDLSGDDDSDEELSTQAGLDVEAVAGMGIDRDMVRQMAGISILRDGFRVRSPGDWLKIAEGMTTGSTYNLRYHNTIGYFGLTGEHNFRLVEKSDREGFVENAAFRGFMSIAETCKAFANEAIEAVRRGQDNFAAERMRAKINEAPRSPERSLEVVENSVQFATNAQQAAEAIVGTLQQGIALFEQGDAAKGDARAGRQATEAFRSALALAKNVQKNLETGKHASVAVKVLRQDLTDSKERMLSLYESAAVGLSARGLAHELRTHIVEIRKRATALDTLIKNGRASQDNAAPHVRAIRASCGSIANAASLIDPLLPRTRAVRESIDLRAFVDHYFDNRKLSLEKEEIAFRVTTSNSATTHVRINRGRLLAVLDNLVRNSVYWLNRGTAVMGVDRDKRVQVEITPEGFIVSDTGPGVDPAYEDSIFEMFVTAKPAKERGQGLGLFIVTQLLAADGCDIRLASDKNRDGRRYKFVVNLGSVVQGDQNN
jgi:signal transduction histidine kinase